MSLICTCPFVNVCVGCVLDRKADAARPESMLMRVTARTDMRESIAEKDRKEEEEEKGKEERTRRVKGNYGGGLSRCVACLCEESKGCKCPPETQGQLCDGAHESDPALHSLLCIAMLRIFYRRRALCLPRSSPLSLNFFWCRNPARGSIAMNRYAILTSLDHTSRHIRTHSKHGKVVSLLSCV